MPVLDEIVVPKLTGLFQAATKFLDPASMKSREAETLHAQLNKLGASIGQVSNVLEQNSQLLDNQSDGTKASALSLREGKSSQTLEAVRNREKVSNDDAAQLTADLKAVASVIEDGSIEVEVTVKSVLETLKTSFSDTRLNEDIRREQLTDYISVATENNLLSAEQISVLEEISTSSELTEERTTQALVLAKEAESNSKDTKITGTLDTVNATMQNTSLSDEQLIKALKNNELGEKFEQNASAISEGLSDVNMGIAGTLTSMVGLKGALGEKATAKLTELVGKGQDALLDSAKTVTGSVITSVTSAFKKSSVSNKQADKESNSTLLDSAKTAAAIRVAAALATGKILVSSALMAGKAGLLKGGKGLLKGAGSLLTKSGPALAVGAAGAAGYGVGTLISKGLDSTTNLVTGGKNDSLGGAIFDMTHEAQPDSESAIADIRKNALMKHGLSKEEATKLSTGSTSDYQQALRDLSTTTATSDSSTSDITSTTTSDSQQSVRDITSTTGTSDSQQSVRDLSTTATSDSQQSVRDLSTTATSDTAMEKVSLESSSDTSGKQQAPVIIQQQAPQQQQATPVDRSMGFDDPAFLFLQNKHMR